MSKTNKAFTRHHDASDKHLTKDNLEQIEQDTVDHRQLLDDAPLVFCEDVGIATFDF